MTDLDPRAAAALADPERVTVTGDMHAEPRWGRHVVKAAAREGSQVVVVAGDFGAWRTTGGFLDHLTMWCERTGVPVMFVDGNHEDHPWLAGMPVDAGTGLRPVTPWIVHVPRAHRWTWRGVSWLGLGGAVSVDRNRRTPGWDWFAEEELTYADTVRAVAGGQVDVMVTHDAPAGARVPLRSTPRWPADALADADRHRELLRSVVDAVRPTHLFHGHFHVRYVDDLALAGGGTCHVVGLDCDGTGARAWVHLDMEALAAQVAAARAGEHR
jgi:hypothetical protein